MADTHEQLTFARASKLYDICVSAANTQGTWLECGDGAAQSRLERLGQHERVGSLMLRGLPDVVMPVLPDQYSLHAALCGDISLATLTFDPETWYLRMESAGHHVYIGAKAGVLVLAQAHDTRSGTGKTYLYPESSAVIVEGILEGLA